MVRFNPLPLCHGDCGVQQHRGEACLPPTTPDSGSNLLDSKSVPISQAWSNHTGLLHALDAHALEPTCRLVHCCRSMMSNNSQPTGRTAKHAQHQLGSLSSQNVNLCRTNTLVLKMLIHRHKRNRQVTCSTQGCCALGRHKTWPTCYPDNSMSKAQATTSITVKCPSARSVRRCARMNGPRVACSGGSKLVVDAAWLPVCTDVGKC
jgi:hypothetical protein